MINLNVLIISVLIAFFGGTYFGYKMTVGEVIKLQAELTEVKRIGSEAEKNFQKKESTLKAEALSLQKDAEVKLQESAKTLTQFQASQTALLSRKNSEIANLKIIVSGRQTEVDRLKLSLEAAKTEAEKAEIRAKIAEEEKLIAESKARTAGLECLSVPIPEEYVKNVNAS